MHLKYGFWDSLLIDNDELDGSRIDAKCPIEGHRRSKIEIRSYPGVYQAAVWERKKKK